MTDNEEKFKKALEGISAEFNCQLQPSVKLKDTPEAKFVDQSAVDALLKFIDVVITVKENPEKRQHQPYNDSK